MTRPVALASEVHERALLKVRGTVQGVGFRPFVYREAQALGLAGWVANTAQGVTVEVEGAPAAIEALIRIVRDAPPPNAVVAAIESIRLSPLGDRGFQIKRSTTTGAREAAVLPDFATCEECLAEIADSSNRRYRYPFTNCTHCGPRYSIVVDLPYDRSRTSMRGFAMCAECLAEYEDPTDRRFHAEPNACPVCGPQLAFRDAAGKALAERDDALRAAADALRRGNIVAVKGLGGFHLMVDARDAAAVARLRQRKLREEKPFAVMFPSLAAIAAEAHVGQAETALLAARERPIVLLRRRAGGRLAVPVAPRNPYVGAMLPYTPLHHLLLADLGFPVVATSGNRSDEPIAIDEREALGRLAGIADLFLVHDRPIVRPVDDSVVRILAGGPQILRRARGYAPAPIVADVAPGILALGGHLKTTVALTTGAGIVLSQHLGDLDTAEARDAYGRAIDDTIRLHDTPPRKIVRDLHPDYHSTHVAARIGVPVTSVQHHLAHVAACMAEHALSPPVLGVAWDGTGYGTDGTIWGGEFLLVTDTGWRRVAHLRPFRLPGGEAAIREPRRSALGLLHAIFGSEAFGMIDLAPVVDFGTDQCAILNTMLGRGVNAPIASSAGRLFDAVAAIVGLRQRATYEGQAAAELEWAIGHADVREPYDFPVRASRNKDEPLILDWEPAIRAILADVRGGMAPGRISAAFHDGLALAIAAVAVKVGEPMVVLSGGCFQNARLSEVTIAGLRSAGLTPWWHQRVPPNDGGVALGQASWAARLEGGA
jgi:hydrogenase maturation protein HypF